MLSFILRSSGRFWNPADVGKEAIGWSLPRRRLDPDSSHYYHIRSVARSSPEATLCYDPVPRSLLGRRELRTDSSFLIIRVLIWTPCSFKFICKATLLLLGPLKQTGSVIWVAWLRSQRRLCHVDPPRSWRAPGAGVGRQQAGLPLNSLAGS